ncbi:hypothetical protein RFI_21256, partial [Reticulomyxa filosa]
MTQKMEKTDIKSESNSNAGSFETLTSLPSSVFLSQAVVHKDEILICGGFENNNCYSYHLIKNQYKRICSYPKDMIFAGHCVMKLRNDNNSNALTLLSFGGQNKSEKKRAFVMKYVSVWNDTKEEKSQIEQKEPYNEWIHFTDNHNNPICIGRDEDNYTGVRGVIGGSNNHLLFITYYPRNITVFNLDTFQHMKHDILPIGENEIYYHCLALIPDNENKKKVKYNKLKYYKLWVCSDIRLFNRYACVCIDDAILFFGGRGDTDVGTSNLIFKYFVKENKWMKFEQAMPSQLWGSIGIWNENDMYIHIIGGHDGRARVSTHIKTSLSKWTKEPTENEKKWMIQDEEKKEIKGLTRIKKELSVIDERFNIANFK